MGGEHLTITVESSLAAQCGFGLKPYNTAQEWRGLLTCTASTFDDQQLSYLELLPFKLAIMLPIPATDTSWAAIRKRLENIRNEPLGSLCKTSPTRIHGIHCQHGGAGQLAA